MFHSQGQTDQVNELSPEFQPNLVKTLVSLNFTLGTRYYGTVGTVWARDILFKVVGKIKVFVDL